MVSVGAVLAFLGLLTFLAVPAARQLDAKESLEEGTAFIDRREVSVVRVAAGTTGIGAVMVAVGWAMIRKRR